MEIYNAGGAALDFAMLGLLHEGCKAYETFILVGGAAQEMSYRMMLEGLRVELVRYALTFPYQRLDGVMPGSLEGWAFDGRSTRKVGELTELAVPRGFTSF